MRENRPIHFVTANGIACGVTNRASTVWTYSPKFVSCGRCMSSAAYRLRMGLKVGAAAVERLAERDRQRCERWGS